MNQIDYDGWRDSLEIDGVTVVFRFERPDDFDRLWEMYSTLGPETVECLPPLNKRAVEAWFKEFSYEKTLPVLATLEEGGRERVVGRAMLMLQSSDSVRHRAEYGVVVHDDYQDKGIGSKLTGVMLRFARLRGLKKVTLEVFPENARAVHVYEKHGFFVEGVIRKHYYFRDRFYDVAVMGRLLD